MLRVAVGYCLSPSSESGGSEIRPDARCGTCSQHLAFTDTVRLELARKALAELTNATR